MPGPLWSAPLTTLAKGCVLWPVRAAGLPALPHLALAAWGRGPPGWCPMGPAVGALAPGGFLPGLSALGPQPPGGLWGGLSVPMPADSWVEGLPRGCAARPAAAWPQVEPGASPLGELQGSSPGSPAQGGTSRNVPPLILGAPSPPPRGALFPRPSQLRPSRGLCLPPVALALPCGRRLQFYL